MCIPVDRVRSASLLSPLADLGRFLNTRPIWDWHCRILYANIGVTGDVSIRLYMSTEHMFGIWQSIDHL